MFLTVELDLFCPKWKISRQNRVEEETASHDESLCHHFAKCKKVFRQGGNQIGAKRTSLHDDESVTADLSFQLGTSSLTQHFGIGLETSLKSWLIFRKSGNSVA